jgi:NADH-quinone oxidoreductase subunit N
VFLIKVTNFIELYVSLEGISFCVYFLMLIPGKKESRIVKRIRGSFIYILLSILASAVLIFGLVNLYSVTGTLSVENTLLVIKYYVHFMENCCEIVATPFLSSSVYILIGLFFKLTLFPFYIWLMEVYKSFNFSTIFLLSVYLKFIFFFLLVDKFMFLLYFKAVLGIISFVGCASVVVGVLGALKQRTLNELIVLSSLGNFGFIFITLSFGDKVSCIVGSMYAFFYLLSLGFILFILCEVRSTTDKPVELILISDLKSMLLYNKRFALTLLLGIINLMGFPPFGLFFLKLALLFNFAIHNAVFFIWFFIIFSTISFFYYVWLVREIFFYENWKSYLINFQTQKGGNFFAYLYTFAITQTVTFLILSYNINQIII